ncbi:MAG TPA: HAMP domain-containing sensor histidine kinase [Polyangiaceae bacterium]|jgi:two-component system phosphate regulon sensor histidine kinase PhoR|nr:HAMP domain-containing sensor histidine kinase [Polyangiaceae bacterium]
MSDGTRAERGVIFLLLPAIVIGVLVLTGVTFRTSFQQERLREQSVVEATLSLANERAARLDQLIIDQDAVVAAETDVGDLGKLARTWLAVAARQTPTVRAVLVLDLESPMHEVVAFASRRPGLDDESFRRLLVNRMFFDLDLRPPEDQLRHLHQSYGGQNYLVSYFQRKNEEHRYLVVAWHDVPRIVHDILPALYPVRDPQSRMNVVDENGAIIFGPPVSGGEFTVGRPFQTTLYKWRVNVSLLAAEELAASAARRRILEMVLVGLSGLVVLAGMVVVVVAAARERKLSALKSDFVANVSHELKTPLSLVRMFAELLQSGRVENDEKRKQYLHIILSESERLSALIENVLDFAKVERGKAGYDFADGSLGEVVARAVEVCRVRAEREQAELELDIEPTLPILRLDERAVEIAIINLVDNALKYAKDSGRIVIGAKGHGKDVEVSVTDEGAGIPIEDRKRIFDRFVRGRGTKQVRGSGIGLALVKHIAVAHGGDAWVEPAEGGGSRFVFTLRVGKRLPEESGARQGESVA